MSIFQLKNSQGKEVNAFYSPTKEGVQLNYDKFKAQLLEHKEKYPDDNNIYSISSKYQEIYNGITECLEFGYVSTITITNVVIS